ncbi:MAG: ADP-ribosylation factor-like protein [Candidatus Odinarchaeota archaeon]
MSKEFHYNIAVAGLFNAGKTSIVQRILHPDKFALARPTRGVDTETVEKKNVKFLIFDLGGQEVFIHTVWKNFIQRADILIYVVDASDYSSFKKARDVLHMAISWNRDIPTLMILANKQDLPAAGEDELLEKFELSRILDETSIRSFQIFGTSAKTGEMIEEAFEWLATKLTGQGIPRANIQAVIVYKKLKMPVSLNQDTLLTEMFQISFSLDKSNVKIVTDFFYNMMGQNAVFIEQIKTLEIIGVAGEVLKLVNVGKSDYYCLLIVDPQDYTPALRAIGVELLDYVIEQERKKGKKWDLERIKGIVYPFLLKEEDFMALRATKRGKVDKRKLSERKTVEEIIKQKEREYYIKESVKKDIDFFTKLSIMDRIRMIEERKHTKQEFS